MKSGARSTLAAALLVAAFAVSLISLTQAAEVQLAGLRLDESVIGLLNRSGWGLPAGIGPLAASPGAAASASAKTSTPTGAAASRAAGGGMGGGRGGGAAAGRLAQPQAAPSVSAAPQTANTAPSELRGTTGMQYWLYLRPGGVRIVLGVEPSGNIATIDAQGAFSPEVYTSKGIGLGDSYFDLISAYGYPESLQTVSDGMRITYSDDDVVFFLRNLRVAEISIGQPPAPVASSVRTQTAGAAQPRAAGGATGPAALRGRGQGGPGLGGGRGPGSGGRRGG